MSGVYRILTANVSASHDDHAEHTHGFEKVVGTDDPLETKASGELARDAGGSADRGLVEVGVEVEELVDLLSDLSQLVLTIMNTVQNPIQAGESRIEPWSALAPYAGR